MNASRIQTVFLITVVLSSIKVSDKQVSYIVVFMQAKFRLTTLLWTLLSELGPSSTFHGGM
jgi:uncharacterized membrane protein YciS (DUF1049 family)